MNRIPRLVAKLAIACWVAGCPSLWADEAQWKNALAEGEAAYAKGDFREALPKFEKAAAEAEAFGEADARFAQSLDQLGAVHRALGHYREARPLLQHALALREKYLGHEHPDVATSLDGLAILFMLESEFAEAEPLYKRALAIRQKALGPEHPGVAAILSSLGVMYTFEGKYSEAEPLLHQALAIRQKNFDPEHLEVASSLYDNAVLFYFQGKYADAVSGYEHALAIRERVLGSEHPLVAETLDSYAMVLNVQGRYTLADAYYQRALAIREEKLGPEHPDVGTNINNLANNYNQMGRYREAEKAFLRALAISDKLFGANSTDSALTLANLAILYSEQGHYLEAEATQKRALAIYEKSYGPDNPSVGVMVMNLAKIYSDQGRYAEAESLNRRAMGIIEKSVGRESPDFATVLSNSGVTYLKLGRYDDARRMNEEALAIREKVFGSESENTAISLNELAFTSNQQGRYAEAERLYVRALAMFERVLGPESRSVAVTLNNLAGNYHDQHRLTEARQAHERALAILEKLLGPDHPEVAMYLSNLASLQLDMKQPMQALLLARRATAIHRGRLLAMIGEQMSARSNESAEQRAEMVRHVKIIERLLPGARDRQSLRAESFEVAQLARGSDLAKVLSGMAARFATGDDELAKLARTKQDALVQWRFIESSLSRALGKPAAQRDAAQETLMRSEMDALNRQLVEQDALLSKEFPAYHELTSARPVSIGEIQQLLAPEEAMVSYLIGDQESYLWVIRTNAASFQRLKISRKQLSIIIRRLRADLVPTPELNLNRLPPFDVREAYALYRRILAPAEPLLRGVSTLLVVPDGALESLPFGVLVTAPPVRIDTTPDHLKIAWLAGKYSIMVLPAESSLRAVRAFAKRSSASESFIGFGDPALGENPTQDRRAEVENYSRGEMLDLQTVRQLPSLPETALELRAMAAALKAAPGTIYLRSAATETNVKRAELSRYRTIAFSTHGLMAGDVLGLAEPALVLTPPEKASAEDDGLLTASEIAQLKLNADWVVLSACNTAAPDGTPGAKWLSGLAKAFFYAGSRAVVVSNWAVSSEATVELMTRMFQEAATNVGRAEALRRSSLALMRNPSQPLYAHPMFWAPFSVVGEGAGMATK